MRVAFTNNKGGTGKTTYAGITAQIIAKSGVKVVAVDLDHAQMHLSVFLTDVKDCPKVPIYRHLQDFKSQEYQCIVIDTPPSMGEEALNAIKESDVVVVPINKDKTGLLGLQEIERHIGREKIIVVTSQWKPERIRSHAKLYEALEGFGYKDAINIPENALIIDNRDNNLFWSYRISVTQARPYFDLVQRIFTVAGGSKNEQE